METTTADGRFKFVAGNDGKQKLIECNIIDGAAFDELFKEQHKGSKITVIHHNDNDGIVSAHLLFRHSNATDLSKFYKCNYADSPAALEMAEVGDIVVSVDYRLSTELISDMINKGVKHVIIMEHHKTTAEDITGNVEFFKEFADKQKLSVVFDANACGAKITNNLINAFNKPIECIEKWLTRDRLIELVDIYDRNADPSCKEAWYLNNYTFKCCRNELGSVVWDNLLYKSDFLDNALKVGKKLYDLGVKINEVAYEEFSKEVMFNGLKCRVLYGFGNGYVFNEHMMEYDAVIVYHKIRDGRFKYSIFSDTGSDIEKVAKLYGGGGHASAAGFTIDKDLFI